MISGFVAGAQNPDKVITYENRINRAKAAEQKINAVLDLAEYYSVYKLEDRADSLLQYALSLAEIANDKELVLRILFNNKITNLSTFNSIERFQKTEDFIKKGLTYAEETGTDNYIVASYIQLSRLSRFRGQLDRAFEFSNKAFTAMGDREADSLKCVLYIETGDNYAVRSDPVSANNNYNNAFDIAYNLKDNILLSEIYHRLSELYKNLGKEDEAKQFLMESLKLNKNGGSEEALYHDYYDLARLTGNKSYIESAIKAAEACGSERCLLAGKRLLFSWYVVRGGSCSESFNYFYGNPDMVQAYKNIGPPTYLMQLGNIYLYCNQPDSAVKYFNLALKEFETNYDDEFLFEVYLSLAQAYAAANKSAECIKVNLKALWLAQKKQDTRSLVAVSDSLANLYARQNDFREAFHYKLRKDSLSAQLGELLKKDKLAVLEIQRQNSKVAADREDLKIMTNRKHNLQLMGITVFLTILFAFMLLLGMFNVSKTTIRLIGYFAFISLFEFIIVLIEKPLNSFTHHEPLKMWSIKIVLIAMLVPIQHFLEGRLISYLQSKKLKEAKRNFFARRKFIKHKNLTDTVATQENAADNSPSPQPG